MATSNGLSDGSDGMSDDGSYSDVYNVARNVSSLDNISNSNVENNNDENSSISSNGSFDENNQCVNNENAESRAISDAGGIGNYNQFVTVLRSYVDNKKEQEVSFKALRDSLEGSLYGYDYCYNSIFLFSKFMAHCGKYINGAWFYKEYSNRRLMNNKVSVDECMYVTSDMKYDLHNI
jgi:hypothetical protein